ncbi:unnamed protein product, partial [Protopolystoma xenopodis]
KTGATAYPSSDRALLQSHAYSRRHNQYHVQPNLLSSHDTSITSTTSNPQSHLSRSDLSSSNYPLVDNSNMVKLFILPHRPLSNDSLAYPTPNSISAPYFKSHIAQDDAHSESSTSHLRSFTGGVYDQEAGDEETPLENECSRNLAKDFDEVGPADADEDSDDGDEERLTIQEKTHHSFGDTSCPSVDFQAAIVSQHKPSSSIQPHLQQHHYQLAPSDKDSQHISDKVTELSDRFALLPVSHQRSGSQIESHLSLSHQAAIYPAEHRPCDSQPSSLNSLISYSDHPNNELHPSPRLVFAPRHLSSHKLRNSINRLHINDVDAPTLSKEAKEMKETEAGTSLWWRTNLTAATAQSKTATEV